MITPVQRAAAALLGLLVLFAVVGPLAWPDHAAQDLSRFLEPPSLAEPLGRDHLGRSVVARLAHATQLSLLMAVFCVVTALLVGAFAGITAAWRGGWIDTVLRGLSEAFIALPALLVVLIFSAVANGDLWTLYVGLALAQWVEYFRMVRSRSGLVLAGPAVEAAGMLKLGPAHIIRRPGWPAPAFPRPVPCPRWPPPDWPAPALPRPAPWPCAPRRWSPWPEPERDP